MEKSEKTLHLTEDIKKHPKKTLQQLETSTTFVGKPTGMTVISTSAPPKVDSEALTAQITFSASVAKD